MQLSVIPVDFQGKYTTGGDSSIAKLRVLSMLYNHSNLIPGWHKGGFNQFLNFYTVVFASPNISNVNYIHRYLKTAESRIEYERS